MKKIDFILSAIIGLITAIYFINIFHEKGLVERLGHYASLLWILLIVFPILSILGIWVSYLIGKKFLFVFQLAKFMLAGVLATMFDLGVLSILLGVTGVSGGFIYDIFKGTSFTIATIAKYIPDKFWAFKKTETTEIGKEFSQFFIVTIIGFVLNVLIAHIIVNVIGPRFGFSAQLWANFGAIVAVLMVFMWNFVGYKFIVFKK